MGVSSNFLDHFDGQHVNCGYGGAERANRVMFEYHALSAIMALSIAPILLFNQNLRRFYTPLAKIVNFALFLQIFGDIAYFAYHPYSETDGNCTEIFLGRLYTATIMFGELHQIYLLANLLGMGHSTFNLGRGYTFSLDRVLKGITILVILSMIYSVILKRSFIITSNLWSIFVCSLQIYFIRVASAKKERTTMMLSSNSSSVRIFDKLSKLELLPAIVCFIERTIALCGVEIILYFDSVTLGLDIITNLLFYLKVILIKENADISLEMVPADGESKEDV